MLKFEIICLAKSRRPGGSCIAGLRTDGGGWIRPIASSGNGALSRRECVLLDGSEIQVLDVVEVAVSGPRPELYQPENWIMTGENWELKLRPASREHLQILWNHVQRAATLFRNNTGRVSIRSIQARPVESSLALIIPDRVEWEITEDVKGKRQTRCHFKLGNWSYNLTVTDPIWEFRLRELPFGNYGSDLVGYQGGEKFLLTVSLGEPFKDNYCYKLVAWVKALSELEALQRGEGSHGHT